MVTRPTHMVPPAARIAAALAVHPDVWVHLTLVDELDDEDAAMVEAVIEHVARRSAEKRQRGASR